MASCSHIAINAGRDSLHALVSPLPPEPVGTPKRSAAGKRASEASRATARLLDKGNQLATSSSIGLHNFENVEDMPLWYWLKKSLKPREERNLQRRMQDVLIETHAQICREIELQLDDLQSMEPGPDLDAELKKLRKELEKWQKTWIRLSGCQSQWIGYKADCCGTALAVPIGCNHRLCFLCNSSRLTKYRERVKTLFGRLTHPVFLTLTVPSVGKLSKRTFTRYRQAWNQFKKEQPWILGGIYAIETTYNESSQKHWHVHSHAVIDATAALSWCKCDLCDRCGKRCTKGKQQQKRAVCRCGGHSGWRWHRYNDSARWVTDHAANCEFVRFKRRIEFDWFLATGGRAAGWSSAGFNKWFNQTECQAWRSESARHEWNLRNRRTVDIRPVRERDEACKEIVKYITKSGKFAHIPGAVKEFSSATRGARMLQTFGSWYGLKLDADVNKGAPSEQNNWRGLHCDCGENHFHRLGVVNGEGVYMEPSGRWKIRPEVHCRT